ncbi:MAG: polysaccharide biosynthesis/export family protein [Planctomycetes bacterium]|nr:polysaccharide biosynthesis/export family protein [Planctomycetota bacterium]
MSTTSPRLILASLLALLLASCASAPPFDAKAVALEWAAYMQRDYVVRAGDSLAVRVDLPTSGVEQGEGTDNVQAVVVSPTGTIDLRRLPGPLQVAGKSVSEVRTLVLEAYKREFNEVRIGVQLTEAALQSIYVAGEVNAPGALPYQPGMTMTQAIAMAGSFELTVKHNDIRILRINPDGTQRTFRVNMTAVLYDEQPDFLLLPGDVVYAQTSSIAEVGNWVELWIRRLLPIQLGSPAIGT